MTESTKQVLPLYMDLNAVVQELAPRLLRYCLGRSGQPDLAEDAAQDALSALVDCWRRSGPPDCVEAFVFTVARRRLARRQWRQRVLEPLDTLLGRQSERLDPEQLVTARSELALTHRGLGCIRPKLREALLLVAVAEMTVADAAQVLGISSSAVKMRVSRARRELQVHMGRHGHRDRYEDRDGQENRGRRDLAMHVSNCRKVALERSDDDGIS